MVAADIALFIFFIAYLSQKLANSLEVLFSQYLGWRHERSLVAVISSYQQGRRSHHGFATAHISLEKSRHRSRLLQVSENTLKHSLLRLG